MRAPIVAIDGPAGAGKSTVARQVAARLGFTYLDTGAMYRAVALLALRRGLAPSDAVALGQLASSMKVEFCNLSDGTQQVVVNGEDVTDAIRMPGIGDYASPISAVREVREAMWALQRQLGEQGGVVAEGRDVQSVVFPGAEVKVFLTASIKERASRRWLELKQRGVDQPLDEICDQLKARDERDSHRELAPLRKVPDAVEIATDGMTVQEVVEEILALVRRHEDY